MAGKLASRRDNPAARAALARRRQRAANLIRPPKEQEQERAPTTKGAVVAYTKPKPLGKEIIPPSSKTRTPPRKTRVNPDTLIVDTSSVIEVIQSPQKQISPLMQRAMKHKFSSTRANTADATSTTTESTPSSGGMSLDKSSVPVSVKSTSSNSSTRTSLQQRALDRYGIAAGDGKSQSPKQSSPKHDELLATSRERRANLESKHRFQIAKKTTQASPPRNTIASNTTKATTNDLPWSARNQKAQVSSSHTSPYTIRRLPAERSNDDSPLSARNEKVQERERLNKENLELTPEPAPRPFTRTSSPRQIPNTGLPPSGRQPSPRNNHAPPASPQYKLPAPPQPSAAAANLTPPQQPRGTPQTRASPYQDAQRSRPLLGQTTPSTDSKDQNDNRNVYRPTNIDPASERKSPRFERLSSFFTDSSSLNDISTIADLTNHQMESPIQLFQSPSPVQPKVPGTSRKLYGSDDFNDDQPRLDGGNLQGNDSTCLQSGSSIMLRAYSISATVGIRRHGDDKYFLAEPLGICLGRKEEVMNIVKASGSSELRYGDTVQFQSTAAKNKFLGARKVNSGGMGSRMELGFFGNGRHKAETWTILSARPGREVLVGRAAVIETVDPSKGISAPVRSGDPILLRNCHNGGVLSVNTSHGLVLKTDSYDPKSMSTSEDPSLMGRLQHHDRLDPTTKEIFQLLLSSTPPCPQWVTGRGIDERVFLTGSYILEPRRNQRSAKFESQQISNPNLSSEAKEQILIDEVIGSFLGLEGLYIRLKGVKGSTSSPDNYEYQLLDADGVNFDVSLRGLVEQILPLSTSYVRVRNFISSRHPGYEYGRVMQALCEGLDELLQDYVNFVAQLERQYREYSKSDQLTMKTVYFQITPSLHSMSILEHATKAVWDKKGGALINTLWSLDKRYYMGDVVAKKVLGILLAKASVPYMEMMSSWLKTGLLRDPYEEFMVKQSGIRAHSVGFDGDAWETLFSVNEAHVLEVVVSNDWTKQKILTTGKYWNAVQACDVDINNFEGAGKGNIPHLSFNSDSSAIAAYIDSMYQSASRVLLRLMMANFKLMESLQIVKRFFLIEQGDFLIHFLDASEQELLKQFEDVSIGRVQHWLSTSVQLTETHRFETEDQTVNQIPACQLNPKAIRCRLSKETLVSYLDSLHGGIADSTLRTPSRQIYGRSSKGNTGIEAFEIDFPRIPFPISLALSKQAMGNYKLLFRHLFFTKHVERRLIGVWRDHQVLKKLDTLRGLLGPTFLLRQRMLHFVQNFIYYMTFEVIENNWMEMQRSIGLSGDHGRLPGDVDQTVDDILNVHGDFLKKTLEACLLTNRELIRSLTKLLNTCLLFTDQMKRFMDTTKIVSRNAFEYYGLQL